MNAGARVLDLDSRHDFVANVADEGGVGISPLS